MISRLGANVQIYALDDWGKTLTYWKGLHPSVMVATINNLNDANRIRDMQGAMPGTLIVARYIVTVPDDKGQPKEIDGAFHTKPQDDNYYLVSPENFLNLVKPMMFENIILYVMNEPSGEVDDVTFDRLVKWLVEVIRLADERKWSLCLPNWGVGHPKLGNNDTELDPRLEPVLMAIANAKMKHYWGLHLYAPVDTLKRLECLEATCKRLEVEVPPTIVSEWGFDTENDGSGKDGYHSRGITGTQFGMWNVDAVKNKLRRFFEDGWLKALLGFSWGGLPRWAAFDTQRDSAFQITLMEAYQKGDLTVQTKLKTSTGTFPRYYPNIEPTNLDFPALYKVGLPKDIDYRNVRALPEEASDNVTTIVNGNLIRMWDAPREKDNLLRNWRYIEIVEGVDVGKKGWLYIDGIQLIPTLLPQSTRTTAEVAAAPLVVNPPPAPPAEKPAAPPITVDARSRDTRLAEQFQILADAYAALASIYREPIQGVPNVSLP